VLTQKSQVTPAERQPTFITGNRVDIMQSFVYAKGNAYYCYMLTVRVKNRVNV